jgi:hypothetical protein
VVPSEAAESLDLDPQGPEYEAALSHLLALGDVELISERDPTEGLRLTRQGIRRAREMHLG